MDEGMKTRGDFGQREPMTNGGDTAREFYKAVVVPSMDVPTVGRMAIIRDLTGDCIGIISYTDPVGE